MKPADLLAKWRGLHARFIVRAYNEFISRADLLSEYCDKKYLATRICDEHCYPRLPPVDWDIVVRRATELQEFWRDQNADKKKLRDYHAAQAAVVAKLQQEYTALPFFGFEVKVVDPHAVVLTMSHRQLWDMAAALLDVNKRLNNTAVYHLRATSAWVTIEMPKAAFDELIPLLGARDVPLGSN